MKILKFFSHYHKSDNLYTLHKSVNNFYATSTKMSHIIPLKSLYHTIVIFYQFMAFQHLSTKFSTYNHFDNITHSYPLIPSCSHAFMLSMSSIPLSFHPTLYNALYALYNALYALSTPHTHINIPLTPKCPTNQSYTHFYKVWILNTFTFLILHSIYHNPHFHTIVIFALSSFPISRISPISPISPISRYPSHDCPLTIAP